MMTMMTILHGLAMACYVWSSHVERLQGLGRRNTLQVQLPAPLRVRDSRETKVWSLATEALQDQ